MATEDEDAVEAVSLKDELSAAFDGPEKATQETAPPEVKAPETATPPLEAPKHWSTDDRTEFTTLPRKVQERWLARETEYARGIDGKAQELARIKRDYEALEGPLKPFERELGLRGVGKSQFLESLVNAHKYLSEQPQQALQWIAQQYGIDPKTAFEAPAGVDQNLQPVLQKVQQLESVITTQQKQAAQRAQEEQLQKITAFAEAKDAGGNASHPYFNDVAEDIVKLIHAGVRDLDVAYTKAIRMNDDVYAKVQADKVAKEASSKAVEQQAKVEKAKKAAVGTNGAAVGSSQSKSLRDDLNSAFASWGN
jgi:hypothetical protein